MNNHIHTEAAIARLVAAHCGGNATAREQHIYREALRSLVRLAVAENGMEVKADMDKAVRTAACCGAVSAEVYSPMDLDLSVA